MNKPKGYPTSYGYKGLVGKIYILFATEEEYLEYLKEGEENDD